MILKTKDDQGPLLSQLDRLLSMRLSDQQRRDIESEKLALLAGAKAEEEAAYQIDFHLKDSKTWVVIHDLRIEYNGRVAQIDHLLIWAGLDIYVVETKGFRTKVRITDDRWEVLRHNHWVGIPSPVAQNDRHILVLKDLIAREGLAPKFFGAVSQPMRFINVVAIPPECGIRGDRPDVMLVTMDQLVATFRKDWKGLLGTTVLSWASEEELMKLGGKLVELHQPAKFDYAAKFHVGGERLESSKVPTDASKENRQRCQSCGGDLSNAEDYFCRMNKARFAGALLCRKCQGFAPQQKKTASVPSPAKPTPVRQPESQPGCAQCGAAVEQKVVAFCRFNSRRFGGKVLCRACQASVQA